MKNKKVQVADWGILSYQEAWDRQETFFLNIIAEKRENRKRSVPIPTKNHFFFCGASPRFYAGKKRENGTLAASGK